MREKLAELLKAKKLRPSVFAREIGLSPSTIDDILKGKTNDMNVGVDKVLKMAAYLGVTVEELYGRSDSDMTEEELMLLDLWHNATEDGREAAMVLLRGYQKKNVAKNEQDKNVV